MKKIVFYNPNGAISDEVSLNSTSIKKCFGMKIRCILIDGSIYVGYASPFYSSKRDEIDQQNFDYINLETFINLDEESHTFVGDEKHRFDIKCETVQISSVSHVDAILYSGLRWDSFPTNKFNLEIK